MPKKENLGTEVNHIRHSFDGTSGRFQVIDDVSFKAAPAETVAILGPSGCGKSTLLRCIAGFLKPESGKVKVNKSTPTDSLYAKKIGFAFQDHALLGWKSVIDNIILPGFIGHRTLNEGKLKDRAIELVELMQLGQFRDYLPEHLSGGMKQRVSLARALLLEPELLLLDEPFGSLDLLTRTKLIVEFGKVLISAEFPSIIVTHSIEEAVFLSDRILILSPRPCQIIREFSFGFRERRTFSLFDDPMFLKAIADCRRALFDHWEN